MQTWTRTEDKQQLPPGPWQDEPDKAIWIDPDTDLDCMINRNTMAGNLCGYVGVDPLHPLHGYHHDQPLVVCRHEHYEPQPGDLFYDMHKRLAELRAAEGKTYRSCLDCPSPDATFRVHGGLTYSGACQPRENESDGICHVPQNGRSHEIWWFGFDCGHALDFAPTMEKKLNELVPDRPANHQRIVIDGVGDLWGGTYRTFEYVRTEVTQLARQIKEFCI